MIIDHIKNASQYYYLGARFEKAFKYLLETDLLNTEPGRIDVDGTDIYILLQDYQSKTMDKGKYEAHRDYYDIQYVLSGEEQMGYAYLDALEITKPYEKESDALLLKGNGSMVKCPAGSFMIFSPSDGHMPGMSIDDKPTRVKKAVVKVKI